MRGTLNVKPNHIFEPSFVIVMNEWLRQDARNEQCQTLRHWFQTL